MSPKTSGETESRDAERFRRATGFWIPIPEAPPGEDALLLRDYQPREQIVAAHHTPQRAKFPAINFHCHFRDQDPARLVAEMDECGVKAAVNMGVGTGWPFDEMRDRFVKPYPDRFMLFASISWDEVLAHKDFGAKAAEAFERAAAKGARGLKLWKNLGLTVRLPDGGLLAIDDPRLDPLYAKAQELDLPVCFHTVDPPAFHWPLDRHNPCYLQLVNRPHWHFHGPQFPGRDIPLEQRNRAIERFPGVTFIGAHFGSDSTNLPRLERLLERFPNFHVDLSARIRYLGRQPYSARRFFLRFADRVLFGTDGAPTASQSRPYYQFLETQDECFRQRPEQWDYLYGIHLPDDVLEKVYYQNAARILKIA